MARESDARENTYVTVTIVIAAFVNRQTWRGYRDAIPLPKKMGLRAAVETLPIDKRHSNLNDTVFWSVPRWSYVDIAVGSDAVGKDCVLM